MKEVQNILAILVFKNMEDSQNKQNWSSDEKINLYDMWYCVDHIGWSLVEKPS